MSIARPLLLALTTTVLSTALLLPSVSAATSATPLRDYLTAKKAAIQTQLTQEGVPTPIHTKVTAESRSGVRRLRIGPTGAFQYLSDSGRDYAGYNLGAGSWDSLVGVLSSAIADEYLVQAAVANIPIDGLDVVFTSIPKRKSENLSYPNNLSYVAYIDSPATDAQLQTLKHTVHERSSAINLVTQPQQISRIEVEYIHTPATRDPSLPPGLRDFITQEKRPAVLAKQREAASGKATTPETLVARAHVEPHTGLRQVFIGKDGYHLQLHDSAPGLLGYGLAPTVEEHLIGVTTTCPTHIFEVQAGARNVLLDSLEVTADAELTPRFGRNVSSPAHFRNIHYKARIESPASEQEILALRDAVEETCPLYNLIKDEQTLEGSVVHGAYTGSTGS